MLQAILTLRYEQDETGGMSRPEEDRLHILDVNLTGQRLSGECRSQTTFPSCRLEILVVMKYLPDGCLRIFAGCTGKLIQAFEGSHFC